MTRSPREMIETLVGFPTVSRDSNLDLIHFVRDYLAGCGVDSKIVPNEDATKANLPFILVLLALLLVVTYVPFVPMTLVEIFYR